MAQPNAPAPASQRLVTAIVVFYLVAALAMVMANKWVMTKSDVPIFFIFVQLAIASLLFVVVHALKMVQLPAFDLQVVKGLLPVSSLNVLGLSLSNLTLKYVDASFYQVARGLVLPFTVLLSTVMLRSRPSYQASIAILAVTGGFFVGVFLDGQPTTLQGISFGVVSSAVTAVHSVVIKKSLDVVNGSALHLAWYMNLMSAVILIPVFVTVGELPAVIELFTKSEIVVYGISKFHTFVTGALITGTLGFLMSIATLLSIKVTSPITHMISSAARGVLASILGVWLFHEVITLGRAFSIAIILLGSMYYTWVKHLETEAAKSHSYEQVPMQDVEAGDGQKNSK